MLCLGPHDELKNIQEPLLQEETKQEVTPPKKYEDKYLESIRKEKKEFEFTDEEKSERDKLLKKTITNMENDFKEKIQNCKKEIKQLGKDIFYLENNPLQEEEEEEQDQEQDQEETIQQKKERYNQLSEVIPELEKRLNAVEQEAITCTNAAMIDKKIQKLNGCFVMESTPLGNVLMQYNAKRESFSYYSDFTVPYRYLEVTARKFVKTFHCRPIFINMEDELKETEKRLEEEKQKQEENQKQEEKRKQEEKEQNITSNKNVFAKLKTYNKATGKVNTVPPPKSSIPTNPAYNAEDKKQVLLKENANRYTYEGKISTFQMLKKVERKVIDKKYALTFADFKRLQEKKKQ